MQMLGHVARLSRPCAMLGARIGFESSRRLSGWSRSATVVPSAVSLFRLSTEWQRATAQDSLTEEACWVLTPDRRQMVFLSEVDHSRSLKQLADQYMHGPHACQCFAEHADRQDAAQ